MYPQRNYLYVLEECEGCENARRILQEKNIDYTEYKIDNPVAEIGTKYLFNNSVYAPFLVHPTQGLFIFNDSDLLKVKL